jgi:hypothetical protein
MSVVAIVGDCTTTTAVAMASAWPAADDVVILEADRSGGSLAGWLDTSLTPSLSTIVANAHALDTVPSAAWFVIDSMVRRSASGLRFIAAPVRARDARRASGEASTTIFPLFASLAEPTMLADCGRLIPADPFPTPVSIASSIVVIHRQGDASAAAASVRLERLAEVIHDLAPLGVPIELCIIGNRPFDLDEIHRFVTDNNESVAAHPLADDTLSAAVFAGHRGVSAKRLARLPLMRSVRRVTDAVRQSLDVDEADGAAWPNPLGSAP